MSSAFQQLFRQPGLLRRPTVFRLAAATLTATRGEKRQKPYFDWPYQTVPYRYLWGNLIDNTRKRITYDSKIVCVEGNLAAGKTKFAQRFAKEFDLLYMPDYQDDVFYYNDCYKFDMRQLNFLLSDRAKLWDREQMFMNPDRLGKSLFLQYYGYFCTRFRNMLHAHAHMLNTGQGAVIDRSLYSDFAWAEALYRMGYWDDAAYNWFIRSWRFRSNMFWKPHLFVYIDIPIDVAMERVRARNIPWEVNSEILSNRKFYEIMEEVMKEQLFSFARRYGQLVVYHHDEFQTDDDWDIICDDVEALDLEGDPPGLFQRDNFMDWMNPWEYRWNSYRHTMCNPEPYCLAMQNVPCYAHEDSYYHDDILMELEEKISTVPQTGMDYRPGFNASLGDKNIIFNFLAGWQANHKSSSKWLLFNTRQIWLA